jgi:hypothetical protein
VYVGPKFICFSLCLQLVEPGPHGPPGQPAAWNVSTIDGGCATTRHLSMAAIIVLVWTWIRITVLAECVVVSSYPFQILKIMSFWPHLH